MANHTEKRRLAAPARQGSSLARLPARAYVPGVQRPAKRPLARAVGSYVPAIARKSFEKYGFSAATLLTDWAVIVGPQLAASALPDRLKWPQGVAAYGDVEAGAEGRPGATLVLRVDPARALEVSYGSRQILERINAYFGYRAVAELRLVQAPLTSRHDPGPAPARPVPTGATGGSSPLDVALARLEAGILGSGGRR